MCNENYMCNCPQCDCELNIPNEFCGQTIECPNCQFSFCVELANQVDCEPDTIATDVNINMKGITGSSEEPEDDNFLDMSDADTRVEIGEPLNESLIDMNECDTRAPFNPTNTTVINLSDTDSAKMAKHVHVDFPENHLSCTVLKKWWQFWK